MAKDPAFLLYSKDFSDGITFLNWEDRGKYITLLCSMHQHGRLDEESIRFLVGSISDKLKSKFKIDESTGLWYNVRLEKESILRNKFIESRTSNGKLGGRPSKKIKPLAKPNENLMDNHKPNLPVNANEDAISNIISFEIFWNEYDKKVGNRKQLEKKWEALSDEDKEIIMKYIPDYKKSRPDKTIRLNPETFLNGQRWNDEIITNSKEKTADRYNTGGHADEKYENATL